MNPKGQPWIAEFRIVPRSIVAVWLSFGVWGLLICFRCFRVLGSGVGLFLLIWFSCPPRSVPGLVWVARPLRCGTGPVFSVVGPGLGWFLRMSSCIRPRSHCQAVVWVIGPLICGTEMSVFRVLLFFVLSIPSPRGRGRSGYLGYSECGTGLCEFLFSLFRWYGFASSSSPMLCRYFYFLLSLRHILAPPLVSGDVMVVFIEVYLVPYG